VAHYKKVKYPALMLFSLCVSLDAFGSSTVVLTSLEEEKGQMQSKRSRVEVPAATSGLVIEAPALPTREELHKGLQRKVRVLINELPKAQAALSRIEGELLAKVPGIRSTNFLQITEFTGLMSSVKVLKTSVNNTMLLASRDCSYDDEVLGLVAITVIGSSALKDQLIKFSGALGDNADTRDVDCRVLMDVSASIHEITKDIADPF